MKFCLFTIALVLGLKNLAFAQECVPSWFEKLPEVEGVRLAIGYSGKFTNEAGAKSAAVQLAQKI